ncbi:hypothetical protein ACFXOD_11105 [Streptomyces sp. NPDC059161]|uniref:hypothetical protein n=1 Tax=Streptomyces sp. NPDC059161 TaxID=3346749 RepID=UPI003685D2EF
MTTEYFTELGGLLRSGGMPEREAAATVADLRGYLAESGSVDPYEEFGGAEEFAARLTGRDPEERPATAAETWKWTADIYTDRILLDEYGEQGWEVEGIDRFGRFVCRRDPDTAMRWEYRRETAHGATERDRTAAALAPDGWEPCGRWLFMTYFKRPASASAGPAAALESAPAAPSRQVFFSAKYRALLVVFAVSVVLLVLSTGFGVVDLNDPAFYWPMLAAAAVGAGAGWYGVKRDVNRGAESR